MQVWKAFLPCVVYIYQWIDQSSDHLYKVHEQKSQKNVLQFFYPKGDCDKCHKYMYPWAHKISNIKKKLWTCFPKSMPHDHIIKCGQQEVGQTYTYTYYKTKQILPYMPLARKQHFQSTVAQGCIGRTHWTGLSRNIRQNTKIVSRKVHGVNGDYFVPWAVLYDHQQTFAVHWLGFVIFIYRCYSRI